MEDKNEDLSLDQYYTSLRDFNQYSKPKIIESNLEEINKNIVNIQDKLEELSGDTIFTGNDEINDLFFKLGEAKNYIQSSLIPATEKIRKLQELLEQRNQRSNIVDYSVKSSDLNESVDVNDESFKMRELKESFVTSDESFERRNLKESLIANDESFKNRDLKKFVVANNESFEYNPKFTNYLNANTMGSLDRLKSIHLSKLDTDILSLIKEIKSLAYYDFGNQNGVFPALQPLYGVYPVEYQPKYGVEAPCIGDQLDSSYIQPKYGVEAPCISDQLNPLYIQPKYGVEAPCIGDQLDPSYTQPKYGVEAPIISDQLDPLYTQPKYGVEAPCIGDQLDSPYMQPKYGVEAPIISDQLDPSYTQPKYGVEAPIISEHFTFTQAKYGVIAP